MLRLLFPTAAPALLLPEVVPALEAVEFELSLLSSSFFDVPTDVDVVQAVVFVGAGELLDGAEEVAFVFCFFFFVSSSVMFSSACGCSS